MKKGPVGLDLVHFTPDYTLTAEENLQRFREAYREVYGEYPPEPEGIATDAPAKGGRRNARKASRP